MQSDPVAVGQRIRLARQAAGLSVKELARRAHISPSHLSDIERGVKHPSLAVAVTLAEALGRSLDWLVTGRDPVPGPLDVRSLLRDPTRPLRYQGLPLGDAAREHLVDLLDAALGLARLAGSLVVQALGEAPVSLRLSSHRPELPGAPAPARDLGGGGQRGTPFGSPEQGVAEEWLRQVVAETLHRTWPQGPRGYAGPAVPPGSPDRSPAAAPASPPPPSRGSRSASRGTARGGPAGTRHDGSS